MAETHDVSEHVGEVSMTKYVCYWGPGYHEPDFTRVVPDSFFANEMGYNDGLIEKVMNLEVFESVNLTEMGNIHIVLRVE